MNTWDIEPIIKTNKESKVRKKIRKKKVRLVSKSSNYVR